MQFMERYGKKLQLGFVLAAGVQVDGDSKRCGRRCSTGRSASGASFGNMQRSQGRRVDMHLSICYAESKGCRREAADSSPMGDAIMVAAARLGEKGWELAAASDISSDNRRGDRILYFKRLKSVLNRSESR